MISGKKLQFCLEIKTCDPLIYTMDHSKFIASIQMEEFISSFKLLLYSTAKSELHVYDETPNLGNFVLLSLTELYASFMLKAHLLWKVSMKSIFSN